MHFRLHPVELWVLDWVLELFVLQTPQLHEAAIRQAFLDQCVHRILAPAGVRNSGRRVGVLCHCVVFRQLLPDDEAADRRVHEHAVSVLSKPVLKYELHLVLVRDELSDHF